MLECLIDMPKKSKILHVNIKVLQNAVHYKLFETFFCKATFICTLYLYMPLKSFQDLSKLALV